MNHGEIVSFLWGVADLIRDSFKRGKYPDVILPLTVLRRLDCVLAPTKENEEESVVSHVFPTTNFCYRRITVERPLRLNFAANPERIARLSEQRGFQNLAKSRKRGEAKRERGRKRKGARGRRPSLPSSKACPTPCIRTERRFSPI